MDFVDKAFPMVAVDEKSGKYVLTDVAIDFFKKIQGPIAVVSVAGLYRTGKSYLLNRVLLQRSNGFGVGPTVNPCTKGLWFWGQPIAGTSSEGEPISIVVIDTEGIGALDEDQTHDTKIFTLAILASSCFVYNSVGSIDETAIQNLSLVVNLTKHIQLRAAEDNEDGEDPDEIASYFPTFYWVVRDFSLQLQDPEGNPITPKDYLERALAPQNGFSDDVEEKNRIRRLLTAFFKERDCITMIRPLVDETKLQNLDKMDLQELRYEFVQQAKLFRSRVVGGIKPKTLHNQKLNGTLYCSMISSYVAAINDGAVPNIENAWNYMCEEQCRRAIADSYELFIRHLQDNMRDLPRPEEELTAGTAEAEDKALEAYREKALGPYSAAGLAQLKAQIRQQIEQLREKNVKESSVALREYIVRNASFITKKLNSQQYSTYHEYEKEVAAMGDKFLREGPKLHNYRFVYLEAVRKLSAQGAEFLFKSFTKNQEKTAEMFKEKEKQMAAEIATLRGECEALRKKYNETATEADQRIVELTNRALSLEKQLEIIKQAKAEEEAKMERNFSSRDSESRAALRELEERLADVTGRLDDSARQWALEQQEWGKERAVFEQQAAFQARQIEELQKKERNLEAQVNLSKASMTKEVREITLRLETDRDSLRSQLDAKTDKLAELTEELASVREELAEKSDKFEKKEKKFKEDAAVWKRESEKTRKELELEKKQLREELQGQENALREEHHQLEAKLKETDRALRELTDRARTTKSDLEKQRSLLEQEMQFMRQENDALRSKVTQLKESHEMALASYQASINQENQESMSRRLIDMKNEHASEVDQLNQTFESEKKRMACEFNNLNSKHFELETRHNSYRTQKDLEHKELNAIIDELRALNQTLTTEKSRIETDLLDELQLKHEDFEKERAAARKEMEDMVAANRTALDVLYKHSQEEVDRARQQAGEEILGYKKRLREEREKLESRHRTEVEELENTLEEERNAHTNEVEELSERLANTDAQLQSMATEMQHNIDILTKERSALDKDCRDLKDALERREQDFNAREAALKELTGQERDKLTLKIEQLATEVREKDRDYYQLKHALDTTKSALDKLEAQAANAEKELRATQERLKQETERLIAKAKDEESQAMESYSRLAKEHALLEQKLQFSLTTVQDLEAAQRTMTETCEKKLENMKAERESELRAVTTKLTNEKTQLDAKYQQLKANFKDLDHTYRKAMSDFQKTAAVLEEKNSHLEGKLAESEAARTEELSGLRAELAKTREQLAVREKEAKEGLGTLGARVAELESEKGELLSTLDKERSLAEQSAAMFSKFKEESKREAEERIRTLEMNLAREQNSRMADKNALDSSHTRTLTDFDSKYRQKTQELNDTINSLRHALEITTKDKDNTIKELTEKYETEKATRIANNANLERRLADQLTMNKAAAEELEKVRKGRYGNQDDKARKDAEDKETLRKKVESLEAVVKIKDDIAKSSLHNFDKEKYGWKLERDALEERIYSLDEERDKLAKMVTKLTNEKEKLRTARPLNKNTSYIATLKPTYEPSKLERTTPTPAQDNNKENSSIQ